MKFRKKPVVVEATQWWENGDHPEDKVGTPAIDPLSGDEYQILEGRVVRFYRHPDVDGDAIHRLLPDTARPNCDSRMHDHGWIDTMEGGHTVCPGDWVITGVEGENYPCERRIFQKTYEPVEEIS